ncbi:MAG TPA: tape measure protein [Methylophilus sp.]|uniref:tape measure protein n=1 Tax=Methylophilus sp. TaxID=29541 RepID=UPI002B827BE3|nr:tape measure protein [Methylophilus sp.]HSH86894.1 tape measure protein [Methylophilus sp.]
MTNIMTGQIDVVMNSTGVDAEIARLQRNIDNFGTNVTRSGKKAGEGFTQVNAKVKESAYQVDSATTRVAQSIVKQVVAMESGGRQAAEYYRQMAQLNGLNASFLNPYLQQLERAEEKHRSFITSVGAVKTAYAGVTAFIAGSGIRQLAEYSDSYTRLNANLLNAATSQDVYRANLAATISIARSAQAPLEAVAKLNSGLTRSLKDQGVEQSKVNAITLNVALALKAMGAGASQSASVITQLSQAFASGLLRGDEFNSMAENAPLLQEALAKSLGVTIGELRSMAENGELSADKLVKAFGDGVLTQSLKKQADNTTTLGTSWENLSNAVIHKIGEMDKAYKASDFFKDALGGLAGSIDGDFAPEGSLIDRMQKFKNANADRIDDILQAPAMGSSLMWKAYQNRQSTNTALQNMLGRQTKEQLEAARQAASTSMFGGMNPVTSGVGSVSPNFSSTVIPQSVDKVHKLQEEAAKADKKVQDERKKSLEDARKAYDSLTVGINKHIETKRLELSVDGQLTESQKMLLDINAQRTTGQLKLTEAQYKNVQSLLATLDAETRNLEMVNLRKQSELEYQSILEATVASRNEIYTTMQDETTALEDLAQAKLDEIEQLSMTKAQIDALNVARYDEQIGVLKTQKAYLQSQPERENEIELINRQIEALGILRNSVGRTEAIQKTKAETDEIFSSMEQASRLVWTVFANSGEDAAKAAGRAIKASILDLLYQMTIKKFFVNVVASVNAPAAVSGALVDTSAGGAPGASIFDRISETFKNSNLNVTSSIEKLGAFLSNGQGGLADKVGGFMGQYSSQIADGIGYLGAAYMATQGNFAGAALTALGTYFGGPIGGAIGGALGSLFGGRVETEKYSTGVSGVYSGSKFTSTNRSDIAGYGRDLGGNQSIANVLKNYSEVISGLLGAYDINGKVNTGIDLFQRSSDKTSAWGYFGANAGGGSVTFSSGDEAFGSSQEAMTALVNKILTQGITGLVTTSRLPEGIKKLFTGLADKDSVQAMIAAAINIGDSQDALREKFNLTADQAGRVSKASGFAGVQLANFANLLVTTANASLTTSEQMIKQRDALNEKLTGLGANASINGDLKAFDEFLKELPKTTSAAQKQFAELLKLRDSVGGVQTAWDQVIAGVNTSIYDLLSPAEQAAKDAKAMNDLFAEFGLQVPKTAAELAAIGQAIQQNFNSADEASIDLALAFPTLVAAFTSAKDQIIDNAREMSQFTNLADYRFYKGVANNYGAQVANDYAGASKSFASDASGKTTLNGEDVSDLVALLKDLRDINKSALLTQRGTTEALEQIRARGLKTTS